MNNENPAGAATWPNRVGRTLPLIVGVLALVVVCLAVARAAVGQDEDNRPRAQVGSLFSHPASPRLPDDTGELVLPWARISIGAHRPTDELPNLSGGTANVRAPEDGSFVRVSMRVADAIAPTVAKPDSADIELVLRADGRDHPLTGDGNGIDLRADSDERWVAVDGHPDDLELVLRIDGEEQVLDANDGSVELGRAAEFADQPTPQEARRNNPARCGPLRRVDDSAAQVLDADWVHCRIQQSRRSPYVEGLGWAEPGHEFLVVRVETPEQFDVSVDNDLPANTHYRTTYRMTAELDGTSSISGPVDTDRLNQFALGADAVQFVFEVDAGEPSGPLEVTAHVRAEGQHGLEFAKARLAVRWTIPGRKLA